MVQPSAANRLVIVAMCSSTTSPATPCVRAGSSTPSQRRAISARNPSSGCARGQQLADLGFHPCERGAFGVAVGAGPGDALGMNERFGPVEMLEVRDQPVEARWYARVVPHPATEREPVAEPAGECEHLEGARRRRARRSDGRSRCRDGRGIPRPPARRRGRGRRCGDRRRARAGACAGACGSRRGPCSRRLPPARRSPAARRARTRTGDGPARSRRRTSRRAPLGPPPGRRRDRVRRRRPTAARSRRSAASV